MNFFQPIMQSPIWAFILGTTVVSQPVILETEILGKKTDIGNGVVVQEYQQHDSPRNVRVSRNGIVIYERSLCSGAEYYKIEDLNGNGSLDFRYGYGSQGTGNVEYSEIIDPLYSTMFRLDCETFVDIDKDGCLEVIARDHGFSYQWNYGVDEIDVRVVRKWMPMGGCSEVPSGWVLDQEACYKDPPTEEEFQSLIREMRSCLSTLHSNVIDTWADDMYDSNGSYLGCIAPKMVELCYTGHPHLAFRLLDESWPGNKMDKIAFERAFVEEMRDAEYPSVTLKFGFFDLAGQRRFQQSNLQQSTPRSQ